MKEIAHITRSFAVSSAPGSFAKVPYWYKKVASSPVNVLRQDEQSDDMDFDAFRARLDVKMHEKRKFKTAGRNFGRLSKK